MLPIFLILFAGQTDFPDQKIDVGVLVEIKPTGSPSKFVRYVSQSPGLVVVPPEKAKDPSACLAVAIAPGVYSIQVLTASADVVNEPKYFRVTAGGKLPGPGPTPGPGPAPGPTPGPGPGPINPVDPTDEIFQALAGIVGGLGEPNQKANLAKLSAVYAKGQALAGTVANREAFDAGLRAAVADAKILPTAIFAVRQYCTDTLNESLGGAWDATKAANACGKIASALAELAK